MISLFVTYNITFVCEDSKQLLYLLNGAVFQFYALKYPEDADDADVSELRGSALLYHEVTFHPGGSRNTPTVVI